jgi:mRNA interferase HigB
MAVSGVWLLTMYSTCRDKYQNDWNDIVKGAEWQSSIDVQTIYRDAEAVGNFTVFNIKGNKYRLIVSI